MSGYRRSRYHHSYSGSSDCSRENNSQPKSQNSLYCCSLINPIRVIIQIERCIKCTLPIMRLPLQLIRDGQCVGVDVVWINNIPHAPAQVVRHQFHLGIRFRHHAASWSRFRICTNDEPVFLYSYRCVLGLPFIIVLRNRSPPILSLVTNNFTISQRSKYRIGNVGF